MISVNKIGETVETVERMVDGEAFPSSDVGDGII